MISCTTVPCLVSFHVPDTGWMAEDSSKSTKVLLYQTFVQSIIHSSYLVLDLT